MLPPWEPSPDPGSALSECVPDGYANGVDSVSRTDRAAVGQEGKQPGPVLSQASMAALQFADRISRPQDLDVAQPRHHETVPVRDGWVPSKAR
jgi:hypothetical protein